MKLYNQIEKLLETKEKVLIAIDGQCASGKSTLGEELAKKYDGVLIHMDDFFLPQSMKTEQRLLESGGNVHYERVKEEVLININNESFQYQKFDCRTNVLEEPTLVKNKNLIIVEGAYALHKELREYYDFKVLLKIDTKTQLNRLRIRNGEIMLNRFINEWIPLENRYFEEENIEEIVDLIILNS